MTKPSFSKAKHIARTLGYFVAGRYLARRQVPFVNAYIGLFGRYPRIL
jgi:hypothetical protein